MIAEPEIMAPAPLMIPPPNPIKPPVVEEFNWLTTLEELVGGRPITMDELFDLRDRASRWPACACSQLCKGLPRTTNGGAPRDQLLREVGLNFFSEIESGHWRDALATFRKIEARAAFLLNEKENYLPEEA